MKIAHIINPVKVTEKSDLFIAQPITFETMRRAQKNIELVDNLEVELYYTCYEEDLDIKPEGFTQTKLLEKSILDYKNFEKKRKLPLIKDILDRLYESSDADYFIYTNVDIALMPHFYTEVKNMIEKGYDGFVINRRTIDNKYTSIDEIPDMYSDIGEKHPGYDCFVFKRDVYPKYELGTACIGANWIGRVIISNVIAYSDKFDIFKDQHLTFHIGDDRSWKVNEFNAYDKHNEQVLIQVLKKHFEDVKMFFKPLLKQFFKNHIKEDMDKLLQKKIVDSHIFTHKKLPASPEKIYGDSYKPSVEWNEPTVLRQDPIFIVGYPRSGTTLLQSLLATQDNIISLPEVHFFNWVRSKLQVKKDRVPCSQIDILINAIRERITLSTNAQEHISKLASQNNLSPKMLLEIIVVDNLLKNTPDMNELKSKRWIEKTPDNTLFLDIILKFYPKAKIVYIMRNPEQAIISRRNNFTNEANWSVRKHAKLWLDSVEAVEKFQIKYPESVKMVHLEKLTDDKESTIKDICEYLNINYNHEKLAYYKKVANNLVLPWESWKKDVKNSSISSNISNNNKKLNDQDLYEMVDLLKDKLHKYGYMSSRYTAIINDKKQIIYGTQLSILNKNSELLESLEELCSYSIYKNPIKKYKVYKKLLEAFHNMEYRK